MAAEIKKRIMVLKVKDKNDSNIFVYKPKFLLQKLSVYDETQKDLNEIGRVRMTKKSYHRDRQQKLGIGKKPVLFFDDNINELN